MIRLDGNGDLCSFRTDQEAQELICHGEACYTFLTDFITFIFHLPLIIEHRVESTCSLEVSYPGTDQIQTCLASSKPAELYAFQPYPELSKATMLHRRQGLTTVFCAPPLRQNCPPGS